MKVQKEEKKNKAHQAFARLSSLSSKKEEEKNNVHQGAVGTKVQNKKDKRTRFAKALTLIVSESKKRRKTKKKEHQDRYSLIISDVVALSFVVGVSVSKATTILQPVPQVRQAWPASIRRTHARRCRPRYVFSLLSHFLAFVVFSLFLLFYISPLFYFFLSTALLSVFRSLYFSFF